MSTRQAANLNRATSPAAGAMYDAVVELASICIQFGLEYNQFDDLVRSAFVQAASTDKNARKPTSSRIALRTGLTRKEVAMRLKPGEHKAPEAVPPARILGEWARHIKQKRWGTLLTFEQFERLCSRFTSRYPAQTIVQELIEAGCIERDENGDIHFIRQEYAAPKQAVKNLKAAMLGVVRQLQTIAYNVQPDEPDRDKRFQQVWINRDIPAENAEAANKQIQELLRLTYPKLAEGVDEFGDTPLPVVERTIGFGLFYYEDKSLGD